MNRCDFHEKRFRKELEYIKNVGQDCRIEEFDKFWEPYGPVLRTQMDVAEVIYQDSGLIHVPIELTKAQRVALERLWLIYGNNGPKHTHNNHRFIQCILENGEDRRGMFKPSPELHEVIDTFFGLVEEGKK